MSKETYKVTFRELHKDDVSMIVVVEPAKGWEGKDGDGPTLARIKAVKKVYGSEAWINMRRTAPDGEYFGDLYEYRRKYDGNFFKTKRVFYSIECYDPNNPGLIRTDIKKQNRLADEIVAADNTIDRVQETQQIWLESQLEESRANRGESNQ